jgi:hypothetical protein
VISVVSSLTTISGVLWIIAHRYLTDLAEFLAHQYFTVFLWYFVVHCSCGSRQSSLFVVAHCASMAVALDLQTVSDGSSWRQLPYLSDAQKLLLGSIASLASALL